MKQRFLVLTLMVLVFSMSSCATLRPGEPTMESFSQVFQVEGSTANKLWNRTNAWCIDAFRHSKDVVQYSDKEDGIIRGKFVMERNSYYYEYIQTTFSIEIKDNRIKLNFYNPLRLIYGDIMVGYYVGVSEIPVYQRDTKISKQVLAEWSVLIQSFKQYIQKKEQSSW